MTSSRETPSPTTLRGSEDPEQAPKPITPPIPPAHTFREPTRKLTAHQFFYIFILDGLGAMVLSGGINFAVAYAMYFTQDTATKPIRLWELPNTLAGDAAVTIVIQCLMTWFIELGLVRRDLRTGGVHPIGFVAEPVGRLGQWWFLLPDQELTEDGARGLRSWAIFLFSQVVRALMAATVSFCVLWGPAVGILTAVGHKRGGDWFFEKIWAPQVFKLVFGGVLGLLTTPLFAMFWLVKAGWAVDHGERQIEARGS